MKMTKKDNHINIKEVKIGKVNFTKNTAELRIYLKDDRNSNFSN